MNRDQQLLPPLADYQLERMGLTRCATQPCSWWIDGANVPWPRPRGWRDDMPRYCLQHWRERKGRRSDGRDRA